MGDGGVHGHCMGEFMGESWGGGTGGQVVGELPSASPLGGVHKFFKIHKRLFFAPWPLPLQLTRCHVE